MDDSKTGLASSGRTGESVLSDMDTPNPRQRSLQGRLLVLLLALVAIGQFPTFLAVDSAVRKNVLERASQDLDRGVSVFEQLLTTRGEQLSNSVQVATTDFGFRQAIADGDEDTVHSMLVNHGGRIKASFALIMDPDGEVTASTTDLVATSMVAPFADLIEQAGNRRMFTTVAALGGMPYQLVLAPIMAPRRIGWVSMGFALDEAALARLQRLTGLELSLAVSHPGTAIQWTSSLPEDQRQQLEMLPASAIGAVDAPSKSQYLSRVIPLSDTAGDAVRAVLQLSLVDALQPYSRLNKTLSAITMLSLLLSVVGAWLLARGVTGPLRRLMIAARRIGAGDYRGEVPIDRNDELGELAGLFNQMQHGIADRERHIEFQAFHDALTGLPNRSNIDALLSESITVGAKTGTPLAVLMLDVNRFKEINDTLGHHIGDLMLIGIAERLTESMRPNDTVARLGGDEFLMVIPGATAAAARERAEQVVRTVSKSLHLQSMDLFPDISIGIALYPDHGDLAADLLRRADIAMYDAKNERLAISMYEHGRDATHLRRLSLINELRRAVTNNELCIHYQPKLAFNELTSSHVEALVRWQHPRDGLIGPDEFIPLAEHAGSIHLITDWMLRNVIQQCRAWSDMGLDIGVAVNISASDLATGKLPMLVRSYLSRFNVAPHRLLLEITEGAVMRDATHALKVLHQLKACGVKLAIDDFGTGHSSLAYLKRLPVDELKIDRSFVMNMTRDADDAVIVRSTIELGHNMGLSVVAEGVEDEQAFRMLKNFHCDVAQGYLISRPLPAELLTEWLNERRSSADILPLQRIKSSPIA
ncbi:MAG: EAL domain-containing protein [Dokdonella sp.]